MQMQISLTFLLLKLIHSSNALGDFSCVDGWTMNFENGQCYHMSEQYASFDVAEQSCEEMSSSLASIHSIDEHVFLLPLLYVQRATCSPFDDCLKYWIGLRKEFGKWEWANGSSVSKSISFWAEDFPSESRAHYCGYLNIKEDSRNLSGSWRNENCKKPMRYICQKVSACPTGFFHVSGVNHCYKLNVVPMSWADASTTCKKFHPRSTLAIITSSTEHDAAAKFLKMEFSKNTSLCVSPPHNQNVWIGGQRSISDRCDVPYSWKPAHNMELPMFYTNWFYRQPDCNRESQQQGEQCIHLSQRWGYQWNDEVCNTLRCSLCQASF